MFRCLDTLRGFLHRQTLGFGTICNLSEWFCISVHRNGNGWFPRGKKVLAISVSIPLGHLGS